MHVRSLAVHRVARLARARCRTREEQPRGPRPCAAPAALRCTRARLLSARSVHLFSPRPFVRAVRMGTPCGRFSELAINRRVPDNFRLIISIGRPAGRISLKNVRIEIPRNEANFCHYARSIGRSVGRSSERYFHKFPMHFKTIDNLLRRISVNFLLLKNWLKLFSIVRIIIRC